MKVTEEEAKLKRCQESFGDGQVTPYGHSYVSQHPYGHPSPVYGGGFATSSSPSMCIASGCMAWRWTGDMVRTGIEAKDDFVGVGYCGKAGRP